MKSVHTPIEVRYAETDQMGIVHHGSYVVWCEIGRTHHMKEMGFHYPDIEEAGYLFPVLHINIDYETPAVYGEDVEIETWIDSYDGVRVKYGYIVTNAKGETCIRAFSSHVCVRKETFKPVAIRRALPDWHEAYSRLAGSTAAGSAKGGGADGVWD